MSGQMNCGMKGKNGAGLATLFVGFWALVVFFANLTTIVAAFLWAVGSYAALCTGIVTGFVLVKALRFRARLLAPPPQVIYAPQPRQQPISQPQQQALTQGGPQLHLPANLSGDDTIRVLRTMRDGR